MRTPFRIEAEPMPCAPYIRGIIFRRDGRDVWVVESCDALDGKLVLGLYRLPPSDEEKERD